MHARRLGEGLDFEESFDALVNPLLENGLLNKRNGDFLITDKGRNILNDFDRGKREVTPIRVQVGSYYRGKY